MKATTASNVSGRIGAHKIIKTDYEVMENVFKGLDVIAQFVLKMEETRSHTMLKLK